MSHLSTLVACAIVAASVAFAGCSSTAPPAAPPTTTSGATVQPCCANANMNAQGGGPGRGMGGMRGRQMMGRYCPMLVRQTTVSVVDASGGAALEFKTSSGDVEDLRARVQHLADMHNHGGCRMMQSMSTDAPGSTASVEDIDGGARLLFRPKDAAQLDALREHARRQAQVFEKGDCPMQ